MLVLRAAWYDSYHDDDSPNVILLTEDVTRSVWEYQYRTHMGMMHGQSSIAVATTSGTLRFDLPERRRLHPQALALMRSILKAGSEPPAS